MSSTSLSLRSYLLLNSSVAMSISSSLASHLALYQPPAPPQAFANHTWRIKFEPKPCVFHPIHVSLPAMLVGWPPCRRAVSSCVSRFQSQGNGTESSRIRNVAVQVAHELLNAGHHYLDVRTQEEFTAGHVEGAVNIPYMFKAGSGMTKNPNFLEEVSAQFNKDDEILVGCQSGKRSAMAAAELFTSDYSGVANIVGGYGAWVESGLPVVR